MTRILGFLSGKIPDRAKATALLAAELRVHLFAFALIVICMEAFLLSGGLSALSEGLPALSVESPAPAPAAVPSSAAPAAPAFPRGAFALASILLSVLLSPRVLFYSSGS